MYLNMVWYNQKKMTIRQSKCKNFIDFFFLLDSTVEEDQLSSCSDDSQKKNEENKAQC